jgi:hypothetical protein
MRWVSVRTRVFLCSCFLLFVYLQLNKKKAKAEGKKCHAKTTCFLSGLFFFHIFLSWFMAESIRRRDCRIRNGWIGLQII